MNVEKLPQWIQDVLWWTQNNYLSTIFEKSGKDPEKALRILKEEHADKAGQILEQIEQKKNED